MSLLFLKLFLLFSILTNEYGSGGRGGSDALVLDFSEPIEIVL